MFYISSLRLNGTVKEYGVTDSLDNVEEFYTKKQLIEMFYKSNIHIDGMIHTGSDFRFRTKTLDILKLDSLNRGDSFILKEPNTTPIQVLYTGTVGISDYSYYSLSDNNILVITRRFLLDNKDCIDISNINKEIDNQLKSKYKETFPTSHLSMFI